MCAIEQPQNNPRQQLSLLDLNGMHDVPNKLNESMIIDSITIQQGMIVSLVELQEYFVRHKTTVAEAS